MKNVTVSMDDAVAEWARLEAARRQQAPPDGHLVVEPLLAREVKAVDPLQPDLFAQSAPEPEYLEPEPHPAIEHLAALDPDSLTPREALDALYVLKGLLK